MIDLPPPLLVQPRADLSSGETEEVEASGQAEVALAFGGILRASRAVRGWVNTLNLHAAVERPVAVEGQVWVPHVCCAVDLSRPILIWERCPRAEIKEKLGASLADVERWARQPQALLRLTSIAGSRGRIAEAGEGEHLSLRWVLANQEKAAAVATSGRVEIDHVSLHVTPGEEEEIVRLLVDVLSLVEIPRPAQIDVPGRWLQAGRSRIHLNSRPGMAGEGDFPGPRPNHLCFGVHDLDLTERNLQAAGVVTRRAGSLGRQLWFRVAGTAIEIQPLAA